MPPLSGLLYPLVPDVPAPPKNALLPEMPLPLAPPAPPAWLGLPNGVSPAPPGPPMPPPPPVPPVPPLPPVPPVPAAPPPGPAVVRFADRLNVAFGWITTSSATTSDSGRVPTTLIVSPGTTRSPRITNCALPAATDAVNGVP